MFPICFFFLFEFVQSHPIGAIKQGNNFCYFPVLFFAKSIEDLREGKQAILLAPVSGLYR